MIERIQPRMVLRFNGFLRLATYASRSYPTPSSVELQPPRPKSFQCISKRFYSSPLPNKPGIPSQPSIQQLHDGSEQVHAQPHLRSSSVRPEFPSLQNTQPQPRPKRSLRPYIYATIFFIFGAAGGQYVRFVIAPPPLPLPGTPEDESLTASIHALAAELPIVKSLSSDLSWRSWDAYSIIGPENRPHRITTGPLGGSRGLGGYQRVFCNASTGEFITVLWVGGALAGWPGVAHGGLVATVLDECMGRCAIARFSIQTGVTANININYLKPTITNAFYVIRATSLTEGSTERKSFVRGTVETMDGKVCVDAKGLFILPKNLTLSSQGTLEMKKQDVGF